MEPDDSGRHQSSWWGCRRCLLIGKTLRNKRSTPSTEIQSLEGTQCFPDVHSASWNLSRCRGSGMPKEWNLGFGYKHQIKKTFAIKAFTLAPELPHRRSKSRSCPWMSPNILQGTSTCAVQASTSRFCRASLHASVSDGCAARTCWHPSIKASAPGCKRNGPATISTLCCVHEPRGPALGRLSLALRS